MPGLAIRPLVVVVALLGVGGLSASASGGIVPVVYSQSQSFQSSPPGNGFAFEFQQFNEDVIPVPLGIIPIIKSIVITIESTMSAQATVENLSDLPSPGVTILFSGSAAASMPGAEVGVVHFFQASSGGLAATDGVPGSGPDFYQFGLLSDTGSDDDKIFGNFGNKGPVAPFVGDGTFPVNITTLGGFAVAGDQELSISLFEFMIEGTITVDIHYNIPAPSTAAILLAAPMLLGRRRR